MKKELYTFLFLYMCCFLYAEVKHTARLVICSPEIEGIEKEELIYIKSTLQDSFEANFSQFTDFQLIDLKNQKKIIELQKKSEIDPFFDERTIIEVGKLEYAEYALFSRIVKNINSYILTCDFTNITTGEKITVSSSNILDLAELTNKPGCVVNVLSVRLFDLLGLDIPNSQRYELLEKNYLLGSDEEENRAKENIVFYQKKIEKIEKEIDYFLANKEDNSDDEQLRLEAIKALNQEKLMANERVLKRLKEEEQRRENEEKKDLLRSETQKKQREELIRKINQQEKNVISLKNKFSTLSQELDLIESKKKTLFEIRNSVEESITSIRKIYFNDYEKKIEELSLKPYRSIELINGKPSEEAKKNRKNKEDELLSEFYEKVNEEEKSLRDSIREQDNYLVEEIRKHYSVLKGIKKEKSVSPNLKAVFSPFNPDKKGWNILLSFEDNYISFEDHFWLSFNDVEGLIPDNGNSDLYEAYLDKVEVLDSCFQRGDPLLQFEMFYTVTPMPDNIPSQYLVKIIEVIVRDTITNSIVKWEEGFSRTTKIEKKPVYKIEGLQESRNLSIINTNKTKQEISNTKESNKEKKDINFDFEDNRSNFANPFILLDSVSFGLNGNNAFLKNNLDFFSIPFSYLRWDIFQFGFGKDGSYLFFSVGSGLEVWLPLSQNFCAFFSGDWQIGDYEDSEGKYIFKFSSGTYLLGIRLILGEEFKWIISFGCGLHTSTNLIEHYKMSMKNIVNIGIGGVLNLDFL